MPTYEYYKLGPVSAYAIAKEHGFEGTEAEWLESLHAATDQVGQWLRENPEILQQMNPVKGTVASLNDLPETAALNDTYYVTGEKYRVTWTGTQWVQSSMSEANYESALSALRNDFENAMDDISEETRNLWTFGDVEITDTVNGIAAFRFPEVLPAGTYTFAALPDSTSSTTSMLFTLYNGKAQSAYKVGQDVLTKGVRNGKTITTTGPADRILLSAGQNSATSAGNTGTWKDIQLEIGSEQTEYIPHLSAVDLVARAEATARHIYVGTDFDNVPDAIVSTYGKHDRVDIHVPAGTWPLDKVVTMIENESFSRAGLVIRPNVRLIGAGKDATILSLEYAGSNTVITQYTSGLNLGYDCEVSDLTIRVKNLRYAIHDDGGGLYGESATGTHATLTNVKAEHLGNDFNSSGLYWAPAAYGHGVWGGASRTFIGCDFISQSYGPWVCHNRTESDEDGALVFRGCSFINRRQTVTSIAMSINSSLNFITWNENQKVHVELTDCVLNRGVCLTSRAEDAPDIGPNAFIVRSTGSDPVWFDKPYVHVDEVVYTDADCLVMEVTAGASVAMYQPISSADGYYAHPYVEGEPFVGIALNAANGENREQVSVRMKGRVHWKYLVSSVTAGKYLDYVNGAWKVASGAGKLLVVGNYLAQIVSSEDTRINSLGESISRVGSVVDATTEKTRNLWAFEDPFVIAEWGSKTFDPPLPPGQYTFSLLADSTDTDSAACQIGFYRASPFNATNRIGGLKNVGRKRRVSFTTTFTEPVPYMMIRASESEAKSAGDTATFSSIQVEAGPEMTDYVPHMSAVDAIARNSALGNLTSEVLDCSASFRRGYWIALNGNQTDVTSPSAQSTDWGYSLLPCAGGEQFCIVAAGQETARTWGFVDGDGNVVTRAVGQSFLPTAQVAQAPVTVTAPATAAWLVVNHYYPTTYNPIVIKLADSPIVNYMAEMTRALPSVPAPGYKRHVVAAYGSMLVTLTDGALQISRDNGLTWSDGVSVVNVGDIASYHLFSSGRLAFFTETRAYYIPVSWDGYAEAACYEADGVTRYVPADVENFRTISDVAERKTLRSGKELYVFGNYVMLPSTPTRRLLWYTTDEGQTYRIAYEFSPSPASGLPAIEGAYACRHVHTVVYYEPNDSFIVCTGDARDTECWVLEFRYNETSGIWTVENELGGSGGKYKWATLALWNGWLYFNYDVTPGSVLRCKYDDIGDTSKHEVVFEGTTNDCTGLFIGPSGEMVVTQSIARSTGGETVPVPTTVETEARKIYYSPNQKDFFPIYVDVQIRDSYTALSGFLPVTAAGHVICGAHGRYGTTPWDHTPSVFLEEYIRKAGFPDAFRPL